MGKTVFEQMGGTYSEVNGYLIPNLELPKQKQQSIGAWGQRHKRYLKEYRRITYTNLLASGKLNSYLSDIDAQAQDMFFRLVKEITERQGITEQLKALDPMLWIKKMENIRNAAMEIVNSELIYV